MNRILPTVAIALVLSACSSTRGGRYGTQDFNANCRLNNDQISIEVQSNGKAIREVELVMHDGTVIQPDAVRGPRGKEIALGIINDDPEAGVVLDTHKQPNRLFVSFPNDVSNSGPRSLTVKPEEGDSSSILLAQVKGTKINSRYSTYGYTCEERTFADGARELVYVRYDSDGERHEVNADNFNHLVAQSIENIYANLPSTAKELSDSPGITNFLAGIFEQGVRYEGTQSTSDAGFTPSSYEFWSNPVRVIYYDDEGRELKEEDPLSSATRLIVNAVMAANSDEIRDLHERVRNGECDENQFVLADASSKARNLKVALDVLRENSSTLSVDAWKSKKYGHYYTLYMGWLQEAEATSDSEEATISRLTGLILQSLTRKGLSPNEKPIAYRMKLQRQFDELVSEFAE